MSPSHVLEPTYQRIKQRLMQGAWSPGERLEALRIADEFGVSMTPVRDSLNRLAGERLVDMKPGDGFRVPTMSEKAFRDILSVNEVLLETALADPRCYTIAPTFESATLHYADRIAGLFDAIASRSQNIICSEIIRSLSERMHHVRMHEPKIFDDAMQELVELERLAMPEQQGFRKKLKDYHERRRAEVAAIIDLTT
jgi:DNA-binding FadR family transcriptional regulator